MWEELVGLKSRVLRPNLPTSFPCLWIYSQGGWRTICACFWEREGKTREGSRVFTAKWLTCLDEAEWCFLGQGMFRGSLGGTHGAWADVTTQSLSHDCSSCHVHFIVMRLSWRFRFECLYCHDYVSYLIVFIDWIRWFSVKPACIYLWCGDARMTFCWSIMNLS